MLIISNVGRGWRPISLGEPLQTTDQYLDVRDERWKVSTYWTEGAVINLGKVPYRRAVSRGARFAAFCAAIPKRWRAFWAAVAEIIQNTFA